MRLEEREELVRNEGQDPQRPDLRFRVWTGEAGEVLSGSASAGAPATGSVLYFDLGKHEWVVRVEVDFEAAPGKYRIEYCTDLEGRYATADEVTEGEWIFLAAGIAEVAHSLVDSKHSLSHVEDVRQKYHEQPALFLRYLRVVSETAGVTALEWRVYQDSYLDLTDRLTGTVTLSRKTEAHKLGQFVRPSLEVELANEDGMLNLKAPLSPPVNGGRPEQTPPYPPVNGGETGYFDAEGVTRLHSYARGTLEVRFYGPGWETPQGLLATGWWPVFCGERVRWNRVRTREEGGVRTTVQLRFESGTVLRRKTTQPLHEQMGVNEFLADWLTRSDDGQVRLMGVDPGRGLNKWVETSFEEYVGRTWLFGDNWRERVLSLEPPERIHAICSTGTHLVALTLDYNGKNPHWWLVRFDFGGKEIERKDLGKQIWAGGYYLYVMDITVGNGKIRWVEQWRARATGNAELQAWGYQIEIDVDDWTSPIKRPGADLVGFPREKHNMQMALSGICTLRGGDADGYVCIFKPYHISKQDSLLWPKIMLFNRDGVKIGEAAFNVAWDPMPRTMEMIRQNGNTYTLVLSGGFKDTDRRSFGGWDKPVMEISVEQPRIYVVTLRPIVGQTMPWHIDVMPTHHATFTYEGLAVEGDYVLGAGFGPDGEQGVAKVGRLGWYLENGKVRSAAGGDVPWLNFPELRLRIGGEMQAADQFALERESGHVRMLYLPESGLEIRAAYDYEPVFGLVAVKRESRWEVAMEAANAFGLVLRIDEIGRLSWRRRWMVERFDAISWEQLYRGRGAKMSWILGQSVAADGLPWIVPESIEVRFDPSLEPLTAEQYTLTAEEMVVDGRKAQRWLLTLIGGFPAQTAVVIRFCVQEEVRDLRGEGESEEIESNAERIVTRAVVKGSRRVPADFAQRVEQIFVVGPADTELFSPFERMQAVAGTKRFEWKAKERMFEESAEEEEARFHVPFDQPLLLGSSRWGVVCGKLPVLGRKSVTNASFSGKRFLRVQITAPSADYAVWFATPYSFRLATKEDFEEMHGNTQGAEPGSADEVKTAAQFYVKLMNRIGSGATTVLAYNTETRWYKRDEWGRLVRSEAGDEEDDLQRTMYAEKRVLIMLRPQDLNGVPIFVENPAGDATIAQATLSIDSAQMTAEGLRVNVWNHAVRENFLGIEVIGYPVSVVEEFRGQAMADAKALARYGEEERPEQNRFLPNREFANRWARELILRRCEEPERWQSDEMFTPSLWEDELVWVRDDSGERRLKRAVEVVHEIDVEAKKSGTRVGVE